MQKNASFLLIYLRVVCICYIFALSNKKKTNNL